MCIVYYLINKGWGKTSHGGFPSEVLLDANLPIWRRNECEQVFHIRSDPIDYRYQFCAGPKGGEEDACDVSQNTKKNYFPFLFL